MKTASHQDTFVQSRPVWPVRLYNRLAHVKARLGIKSRPFTAERLLRDAERKTGLRDLGGDNVEVPLNVLVESFERDARLHEFGRMVAYGLLLDILVSRLRLVEAIRQQPGILDVPIRRPLLIVGPGRTGTTLLHNLLAQDPGTRFLSYWESVYTLPPPETAARKADPRIRKAARKVRMVEYLAPALKKAHTLGVQAPEECVPLLNRTLVSAGFSDLAYLPSYERWLRDQPNEIFVNSYRFYRQQLQLLQWRRSRDHWVLKAPAHSSHVGPEGDSVPLLNVFPDARIVVTHRDPAKVLPSSCSLVAMLHGIMSQEVDPYRLGGFLLEKFSARQKRTFAYLDRIDNDRILHVHYIDLMQDPVSVIHRIYDKFGYTAYPEMEVKIRKWLIDHPRSKHGVHAYSASQFGLRAEDVEAFSRPYRERFQVAREV